MSFTTATRALMLGIAALTMAGTAQAQVGPTPEGTQIKNKATATYKDGVGPSATTYTAAPDSVIVTVGFKAGVTLPGTDGTQTPAVGSTGNEYEFTVTNSGNGDDTLSVAFTPSTNITITGYRVAGGAVLNLAAFNAAMAALELAANGTVDVTVIYTVGNITGGGSESIDVVASSERTTTTTDTHQLDITPASVAVTPDGSTDANLPGSYTAPYTITNNSSLTMTYTLSANSSDTDAATTGAITHGSGGTFAGGQLTLTAGQSGTVNLAYTIPASATPGASTGLQLTAISTADTLVRDSGSWTITVNRPLVVLTKAAFRDNRTDLITAADSVSPGEWIQYRITVRNTGNFDASDVSVADVLPTQVTFATTDVTADAAGWVFTGTTTAEVKAVLTSLGQGAANERYFWIRVQIK